MTYDRLFGALRDPTRRAIYDRLRSREHAVGELVGLVQVSQPAVSQHLAVLRQAGLAIYRKDGTRRLYRASAEGLDAIRAWVEGSWDRVREAHDGSRSEGFPTEGLDCGSEGGRA